ncbi:hypothetical protein GCM10007170_40930 [Arthrobacter liuii]|uniref:Cyclic nucleotide-binding domain-containing protein n=1 Tax=Arthrobacter liuii TaxID=1476996 RepID=A0ABQ2AXP6_9MICC|nr:hypothetical protein GCM10007170_40930 [Arthrobacter liuii]
MEGGPGNESCLLLLSGKAAMLCGRHRTAGSAGRQSSRCAGELAWCMEAKAFRKPVWHPDARLPRLGLPGILQLSAGRCPGSS